MNNHVVRSSFVLAVILSASACTTIGQLPCQEGQIAKFNGTAWRCAMDETGPSMVAARGTIWLNHQDLVISKTRRIMLDTNGTDVFVKLKPNLAANFPERELISLYVSTIPPGFNVTGMRVCYGIVGNHADTKVHRLRLAQFRMDRVGAGTTWPGYLIRLEDTAAGDQAPTPPPGGFAFGDPEGFVCVDSASEAWSPCLDPARGTISADTGVQIGDPDDRIVIQAIAIHYDRNCTPQ